jgi:hypothetical protein
MNASPVTRWVSGTAFAAAPQYFQGNLAGIVIVALREVLATRKELTQFCG